MDGAKVVKDTWSRHVAAKGTNKDVTKFVKPFMVRERGDADDLLRDLREGLSRG